MKKEELIITNIKHIEEYKILVVFSDGTEKICDFKNFVFKKTNPMITQFQDVEKFKKFTNGRTLIHWSTSKKDAGMTIGIDSIYNNDFTPEWKDPSEHYETIYSRSFE